MSQFTGPVCGKVRMCWEVCCDMQCAHRIINIQIGCTQQLVWRSPASESSEYIIDCTLNSWGDQIPLSGCYILSQFTGPVYGKVCMCGVGMLHYAACRRYAQHANWVHPDSWYGVPQHLNPPNTSFIALSNIGDHQLPRRGAILYRSLPGQCMGKCVCVG